MLNYPHQDAQMKTHLPQLEDVSVNERYCIGRGQGGISPLWWNLRRVDATITGFIPAVSMRRTCVASTSVLTRSGASNLSELATEESYLVVCDMNARPVSHLFNFDQP